MCHCSICRYLHGAPCCFHTPLPPGVEPQFISPSNLSKLTTYDHPTFQSTKLFCSTCGCHVGDRGLGSLKNTWTISTSIFNANREDSGTWEFATHMLPYSTPDGGLSSIIPSIDGRQLELETRGEEKKPDPTETTQTDETELLAQCHCGGVSFKISRPKPGFIDSPESEHWLLPANKNKWLACFDLCDDCRLVNGTHVIGWMFVPTDHISPSPPSDLKIGTSKIYRSSSDTIRTFCGTCGATVFYWCSERKSILDVSTGILRAPEGAMAEKWALWRSGRPSWAENGARYDARFTHALTVGLKEWGLKRGHPHDFYVP
ncbi:hypothetical protein N7495_007096 [Penicillium taxi]|uniref:uncharacterized protein n=1 Tax=Penicillium taxi TaxID=168475 RepID=UPI0025452B3F|nr:uncharacterized protein N7495_007096 [Penicillium taxi]KAJ5895405.1 hypothetical protein N7495_007096 [Penicillium taxi]